MAGHWPLLAVPRHNGHPRRAVIGPAQRPPCDDLVRDRVHSDDPTAHPIGELLLMVRLDRVDCGGEFPSENVAHVRIW